MSEAGDALREMAANRGFRLVRSRRRKPGGDFGRYGLKDAATGGEVLGFGKSGLTATGEEVQAFLRGGHGASWKRSLIAAVPDAAPARPRREAGDDEEEPSRKGKTRPKGPPASAKAGPTAAAEEKAARPRARPKPAGRPKKPERPKLPQIREARPRDAEALAKLVTALGYAVTEADVRRRLRQLAKAGEPALVAYGDAILGCLTWHVTPVLHRPRPVGRITLLVVDEAARGGGIGAQLAEAAEARLRDAGCGLVEVTSNVKRLRAHGFYERQGYERTSYRFAKVLQD